jgi:hypothetical protein
MPAHGGYNCQNRQGKSASRQEDTAFVTHDEFKDTAIFAKKWFPIDNVARLGACNAFVQSSR